MDKLALLSNQTISLTTDTGYSLEMKQPTLNDIVSLGYETYQTYTSLLISSVNDIADILWFDMKVWYEDMGGDWLFFLQRSADMKSARLIKNCKGFDFYGAIVSEDTTNALNFFLHKKSMYVVAIIDDEHSAQIYEVEQYKPSIKDRYLMKIHNKQCPYEYRIVQNGIVIDEKMYTELVSYLKDINWNHPEYTFLKGGTRRAKIYILQQVHKDRQKPKGKETITFESIVSSLIAKGIPYNHIWDMPIYAIYDQYHRYTQIDTWNTTMGALNSGNLDTSKHPIKWDKINWSAVIQQ